MVLAKPTYALTQMCSMEVWKVTCVTNMKQTMKLCVTPRFSLFHASCDTAAHAHTLICAHAKPHTHTHTHKHTHTHTHTHTCAHANVLKRTHIRAHAHAHTQTHTCTHARPRAGLLFFSMTNQGDRDTGVSRSVGCDRVCGAAASAHMVQLMCRCVHTNDSKPTNCGLSHCIG